MKHDGMFEFERTHLERLKLAAEVILSEADEHKAYVPAPLEAELVIFKERVEKALLLPPDATDIYDLV